MTEPEEDFATLFEESLTKQEMRQGELITAEVVRVDFNIVVVNAGLKSESFINIDEFKNDKGEIEVKPGDFVTVAIESLEDGTHLAGPVLKKLAAIVPQRLKILAPEFWSPSAAARTSSARPWSRRWSRPSAATAG